MRLITTVILALALQVSAYAQTVKITKRQPESVRAVFTLTPLKTEATFSIAGTGASIHAVTCLPGGQSFTITVYGSANGTTFTQQGATATCAQPVTFSGVFTAIRVTVTGLTTSMPHPSIVYSGNTPVALGTFGPGSGGGGVIPPDPPASGCSGSLNVAIDAPTHVVLPQTDMTLFAYPVTRVGVVNYLWSKTAGAAVTSTTGTYSPASTVRFAAAGSYTFNVHAVDSGTADTCDQTVTVLVTTATANFYVDPTYSGGSSNGSASRPWLTLSGNNDAWIDINLALLTNDVVVYYTARAAGADTAESDPAETTVMRTDTSDHYLVIDGHAKYNSNDATPSWLTYAGANMIHLGTPGTNKSIGIDSDQTNIPMNRVTIRGVYANGARITFAGNYSVVENSTLHTVTGPGTAILFHWAVNGDCAQTFGNLHNISIRGNTITDSQGEGIYINGNYLRLIDHGCLSWLTTHWNILIEGNDLERCGASGDQGDCIDLKAGLRYIDIRNNTIKNVTPGMEARGIVSSGLYDTVTYTTQLFIEDNFFDDAATVSVQQVNIAMLRNNVLLDTGLILDQTTGQRNRQVYLLNNTFPSGGVYAQYVDTLKLRNNIFSSAAALETHGASTGLDTDYNAISNLATYSNWTEGAHSIVSAAIDDTIYTDAMADDFTLTAMAPPVNAGQAQVPTFPDKNGVARPVGGAWDMGAYER